jgi:hypothetical protein
VIGLVSLEELFIAIYALARYYNNMTYAVPTSEPVLSREKQGESEDGDAVNTAPTPAELRDSAEKATSAADNLAAKQPKQRGRPFVKGQSGNPAGRPPKSRNNSTKAIQVLLDGEAQALIRKAVELALEGNTTALRMCLDRLMVPRRDRAVPLAIEPIRDAGDLAPAMGAIMTAAGRGKISPGEGLSYARLVDVLLKAIDAHGFERRLQELEKRTAATS